MSCGNHRQANEYKQATAVEQLAPAAQSSCPRFARALRLAAELGRSAAIAQIAYEMTFIDWSDSEGMFDLFIELVRNEISESLNDPERQQFLRQLLAATRAASKVTTPNTIKTLRGIQDSLQEEFENDAVYLHLTALIDELERTK